MVSAGFAKISLEPANGTAVDISGYVSGIDFPFMGKPMEIKNTAVGQVAYPTRPEPVEISISGALIEDIDLFKTLFGADLQADNVTYIPHLKRVDLRVAILVGEDVTPSDDARGAIAAGEKKRRYLYRHAYITSIEPSRDEDSGLITADITIWVPAMDENGNPNMAIQEPDAVNSVAALTAYDGTNLY